MSPTVSHCTESALTDVSIDIEAIVRRVLMQLRQESLSGERKPEYEPPAITPLRFDGGVCSLDDVKAIDASVKHLQLSRRTVITPAARDELRHRGVMVTQSATTTADVSKVAELQAGTRAIKLLRDGNVADHLFEALQKQLRGRGVRLCRESSVEVILSSRPATTAHQRTGKDRCVVAINRIDDVQRFMAELSPNTFVLDVAHLHLVALARAIAVISKPTSPSISTTPIVTVAGALS